MWAWDIRILLIFGVDSREGEMEKGTRTDCLIVASLNNETKEVRLVSVYRDSFLDLSDGTLQKCNAAYSYGGAEQAINMLNMNLDLVYRICDRRFYCCFRCCRFAWRH